jgi:hypothetical protein
VATNYGLISNSTEAVPIYSKNWVRLKQSDLAEVAIVMMPRIHLFYLQCSLAEAVLGLDLNKVKI